jgi:hypothetical protein
MLNTLNIDDGWSIEPTTTRCDICFEDLSQFQQFTTCDSNENYCKSCLKKWTETAKVTALLGSSFTPRRCHGSNPIVDSNISASNVDDPTLQNAQEYTRPCPGCTSYVEKTQRCPLIEFLCGHRFCHACGAARGVRGCDDTNHLIVVNVNFRFRENNGFTDGSEHRRTCSALHIERSICKILKQQKERRATQEKTDAALQKSRDIYEKGYLIRKKEAIARDIIRDNERMARLVSIQTSNKQPQTHMRSRPS